MRLGLLSRFDKEKALNDLIWGLIRENAELYARVALLERRVGELEEKLRGWSGG